MMILIFAFEMGLEGQGEGRGGREEALLEDERHQVAGAGLGRARLGAAGGGVELEQVVGLALGIGVGDVDRVDRAGGEALGAVGVLDVGLEAADHDLVECGLVRFAALEEALRVEHLQQRLPRPRVAVVRGRGQEEMVLAVLGEPSDRLRLLALNRVAVGLRRLGGCAVVDLIHDQQVEEARESAFARQDLIQHALDARRAQPLQADDRARVDGEGVGFEPMGSPEFPELGGVHDREAEAELGLHLLTPLQRERRRADDDDAPCPVSQQHLLHDQASLDRLAEAHVVGDEQVDPRHGESTGDGFELVLLDRDAGPERGLQRPGVGAGHGAPADGVEEGAELLRIIPVRWGHCWELGGGDDLAAGLDLPGDGQLVAEVVVTDAGEGDEGTAGESCRGELVLGLVAVVHLADHPLLPADPDKLSGLRHVRIP